MARSFDPAGFWYDFRRPKLQNPDGSFSTEETITVGIGNQYFNIPTIWDGRRVSQAEAITRAIEGLRGGGLFPHFATLEEAEKQAKLRSEWRGLIGP